MTETYEQFVIELKTLKDRAKGNYWYRRFHRKLVAKGKPLAELTMAEFVDMVAECLEEIELARPEADERPTLESLYGDGHYWP